MRRPYGGGSVTYEHGKWRARLPLRLARREIGAFDDEAEAHAALTAALELDAEKPIVSRTIDDVVREWSDGREVRENTRKADLGRWRTYAGDFGRGASHGLTAADVETWWKATRRSNPTLSFTSLSNLATVVRGAFPKLDVSLSLPKRTRRLPDWLKGHEIARVLGCQAVPLRCRIIYGIRIFTGLRPGELWGANLDDLDLDRGVLAVRHSRENATKTHQEREVELLWPARVFFEMALEMRPASRSRLLFPSPASDTHYSDGYDAEWYEHRKLFRLGRPFTFYALRHTCASHLLQGTWAPQYVERPYRLEEVSKFLGHDNVTTTQLYAHLCADSRHALAKRLPEEIARDRSHTPDLNRGPTVYEGPREAAGLRLIQGEADDSGNSPGNVAERVLEAVANGDEISRLDVVRLAAAVRAATSVRPPGSRLGGGER